MNRSDKTELRSFVIVTAKELVELPYFNLIWIPTSHTNTDKPVNKGQPSESQKLAVIQKVICSCK